MTTNNIILIAALVISALVFFYIYFGAKKLHASREARVAAEQRRQEEAQAPSDAVPATAVPISGADAASPVAAADAATPVAAADAASPFLAAPDGEADDLTQIKGIGPKLSARLAELGVFHFRQIANWTPAQLAAVDAQLGNFQGRPERDQWQSQARLLASGDRKAYERAHGKLGDAAAAPSAGASPGSTP